MKIFHTQKGEKTLRNKVIPLVKVLWRYHNIEEATWEHEDDMRKNYPELFETEILDENSLRGKDCDISNF